MTLMAAARVSAPVFPLVVEKSGVRLRDERAGDALARERLLDASFGPARFEKTCERLREGRIAARGRGPCASERRQGRACDGSPPRPAGRAAVRARRPPPHASSVGSPRGPRHPLPRGRDCMRPCGPRADARRSFRIGRRRKNRRADARAPEHLPRAHRAARHQTFRRQAETQARTHAQQPSRSCKPPSETRRPSHPQGPLRAKGAVRDRSG